jgi:hypothetical protein
MRLKCPVAIAEQHRDRLALEVGRRYVPFPVALESPTMTDPRIGRGCVVDWSPERSF